MQALQKILPLQQTMNRLYDSASTGGGAEPLLTNRVIASTGIFDVLQVNSTVKLPASFTGGSAPIPSNLSLQNLATATATVGPATFTTNNVAVNLFKAGHATTVLNIDNAGLLLHSNVGSVLLAPQASVFEGAMVANNAAYVSNGLMVDTFTVQAGGSVTGGLMVDSLQLSAPLAQPIHPISSDTDLSSVSSGVVQILSACNVALPDYSNVSTPVGATALATTMDLIAGAPTTLTGHSIVYQGNTVQQVTLQQGWYRLLLTGPQWFVR